MAHRELNTLRLMLAALLAAYGAATALATLLAGDLAGVTFLRGILLAGSPATGVGLALGAVGVVALVAEWRLLAIAAAGLAWLLALAGAVAWLPGPHDGASSAALGVVATVLLLRLPGVRGMVPWRWFGAAALLAAGLMAALSAVAPALIIAWAGLYAVLPGPDPEPAAPEAVGRDLGLPLAVFVVILVATLTAWLGMMNDQIQWWQERTDRALARFTQQVESAVDLRVQAIERMVGRWEYRAGMPEDAWRQDASAYLRDFPGLAGMALLEADGRVLWLQGRMLADPGGFRAFAEDGRLAPVFARARRAGATRISAPERPADAAPHVYLVSPLYRDRQLAGYLMSLRQVGGLFRHASEGVGPDFVYRVIDADGRPLYGPEGATARPYAGAGPLDVLDAAWRLEAWPSTALLYRERSALPDAVLLGGSGLALAGLLVMRLTLLARARALLAAIRARALQREVEDRRQAESQRQATARRLEETLDSLADGFFTMDRDLRITYVNRVAAEAVGLDREYVLGRHLWTLFPDSRRAYASMYEGVLDDGRPRAEEIFDPALQCWIEVRAYPMHEGLAVYFRDVTEVKANRDQLVLQGEILEQIHDAVVGADLGGNITFWNRGAERLFGVDAEEATGAPLRLLRPGPDYLSLRRQLIEPLLDKGAHETEVELEHRTRGRFTARVSMSLARDANGRAYGMLAFILDVSERVRFQNDLQEALARAQLHAGRLRELGRLSLTLNSTRGRCRTLETLARESRTLMQAHLCRVTLVRGALGADGEAVIELSEKYAGEAGIHAEVPDGFVAPLRASGEPLRLDREEIRRHAAALEPLGSWLAVPLVRHDGGHMGLLEFGDAYAGAFSGDDEAVAVQLAQLAAAVLDKTAALEAMRDAEAHQREQLEFLTTVTRSVGEGIVVVDVHGRVDYANPGAARLLARDAEDLHGRELETLMSALEPEERMQGEAAGRWRATVNGTSGAPRVLELRVARLGQGRWQDGQVIVFREIA